MKNMKKLAAFVVVLVMLFALAACSGGSKEANVDLNAFYNELAGKYEFSAHVDTEGEMLEMTLDFLRSLSWISFCMTTDL